MFDGKAFGAEMTEIVKGFVDRATAPLIAENKALVERIAALELRPAPEKGDKGEPGDRGDQGKDGRGVKDLLIDRNGELVATMDDGSTKSLGPVIGKDGRDGTDGEKGEPGKDGRDGFSLDDFDIEPIDERSVELRFTQGDVTHAFELTFPVPVYRGVFKQGETYIRGDVVTWGGCAWHCEKDTAEKPDSENWTLMVKKGRDGKDAKHG